METFLSHIYAFAEIYSVLLCWLVVPLIYAAAYFYFVRNLTNLSQEARPVSETAPQPVTLSVVSSETSAVPPAEAVTEEQGQTPPETTPEASAEAPPEEAKVANG